MKRMTELAKELSRYDIAWGLLALLVYCASASFNGALNMRTSSLT